MTSDDYERETLERAGVGDSSAQREVLALATDALRRGLPISQPMRIWLADALTGLQSAIDPDFDPRANEGQDGTGPKRQALDALSGFGFEKNPRHRKASGETPLRKLEISAAVHVLSRRIGKSAAVHSVAYAVSASEKSVYNACRSVGQWPSSDAAERAAVVVLARLRVSVEREPHGHCTEVREFLAVTRTG